MNAAFCQPFLCHFSPFSSAVVTKLMFSSLVALKKIKVYKKYIQEKYKCPEENPNHPKNFKKKISQILNSTKKKLEKLFFSLSLSFFCWPNKQNSFYLTFAIYGDQSLTSAIKSPPPLFQNTGEVVRCKMQTILLVGDRVHYHQCCIGCRQHTALFVVVSRQNCPS